MDIGVPLRDLGEYDISALRDAILALDEETWQLLEHHALKDVAENKEVNSE